MFLQLLAYEIFASKKHSEKQYSTNIDTERGIDLYSYTYMLFLMFSLQCLYEFIRALCFYVCVPQCAVLTWPQKFQFP